MKNKKIKFLVLVVVLLMGVTACNTDDTQYRNMQTRLNDNNNDGWFGNNGTNNSMPNNDRINTNLNNGMTRRNTDLNDNNIVGNNNLNNDMWGNNTDRIDDGMLNTNIGEMSTRANKIAKRVTNLKEVASASVIINGKTAVVGIESKDRNMDGNISSDMRKRVEAAVKSVDKDIDKVSISMDPDIYSRLKTMSTNMERGNAASNFSVEIKDIMRRITEPLR